MAKAPRPWCHLQPPEDFQREIDELFSRFVGGRDQTARPILAPRPMEFLDGSEYIIRIDLPGIEPKDLEGTVTENVVIAQASHHHHDEQEDWDFIHCELTRGGL